MLTVLCKKVIQNNHKINTCLINICKSATDFVLIYINVNIIHFFEIMEEYEHFHPDVPRFRFVKQIQIGCSCFVYHINVLGGNIELILAFLQNVNVFEVKQYLSVSQ